MYRLSIGDKIGKKRWIVSWASQRGIQRRLVSRTWRDHTPTSDISCPNARLEQAFNRWMGVTIYYQGAWRDRQNKSWVDESFHMLERVKIFRDEYRGISPDHGTGGTSYFEWNEVVFKPINRRY